MWVQNERKFKRQPDFTVKYRMFKPEEGGRRATYQGLRCDWAYAGDDIYETGIYMIHPEFEDRSGEVITDEKQQIELTGTARMWIIVSEMKENIHTYRIKVGVKGYFMEGSRRIGEAEIVRVGASR